MRTLSRSIGAAGVGILAGMAVAGPADSSTALRSQPIGFAPDPCPVLAPMSTHQPAAAFARRGASGAFHARYGFVLRVRLERPPTADTGFTCPIDRTGV